MSTPPKRQQRRLPVGKTCSQLIMRHTRTHQVVREAPEVAFCPDFRSDRRSVKEMTAATGSVLATKYTTLQK